MKISETFDNPADGEQVESFLQTIHDAGGKNPEYITWHFKTWTARDYTGDSDGNRVEITAEWSL